PDVAVEQVGLVALDVAGAVFEAEQVAWCCLAGGCRGRAAETELEPAVLDDTDAEPGQVADGVEGDERIVGAGLDAEGAAASVRVEVFVRQRRERSERVRSLRGEAEARVEQRGAVAERDREASDRGADRLPRVERWPRRVVDLADELA